MKAGQIQSQRHFPSDRWEPRRRSSTPWLALAMFFLTFLPLLWFISEKTDLLSDIHIWFVIVELPFLFTAVFFGFMTANALKGGVFGQGIRLMAWGFLVMGAAHFHLMVTRLFGYDLFAKVFGDVGGTFVVMVILAMTWTLSGLGFYRIYRISKSG